MSQTLKLNAVTLDYVMNKIVTYGGAPVVYNGDVVTYE